MSAPRRITPPSAPAAPRSRTPIATLPWNLAEFHDSLGTAAGPFSGIGCTSAELTALREQMQEQNVRVVADARRAGFDEGRAAGRAEAEAAADGRVAHAVHALEQAARTIRQQEEHYAGVLEENLVALACGIARHVIQREVQLDQSRIRALVQSALAEFPHEGKLRVRLHPAEHALLHADPGYPEISWIADARIARGGCVVEGRERIVDGRVDLALEQVFTRLTGSDV